MGCGARFVKGCMPGIINYSLKEKEIKEFKDQLEKVEEEIKEYREIEGMRREMRRVEGGGRRREGAVEMAVSKSVETEISDLNEYKGSTYQNITHFLKTNISEIFSAPE